MKKILKSSIAGLPLLAAYQSAHPTNNWEQFRDNKNRYQEVKTVLKSDQRGLCAYCELDLLVGSGGAQNLDDFRVEHVVPKSTPMPPNHALDWENMLAVCTGGNAKHVTDVSRFTKPEFSCDVPKDNSNWVGVVLDSLVDIPAFPNLFEYSEHNGYMQVSKHCPSTLKSKAQNSIDNFNLNTRAFLASSRKGVVEKLRQQITEFVAQGWTEKQAAEELAKIYFDANTTKMWPAFFSCIRWYLGQAAEAHLSLIQYQG